MLLLKARRGESQQPSLPTRSARELGHTDERRLKAIQKIEVNAETFPAVVTALDDERSAVQRWAAAILGTSGMPEALEPLCRVLSDSSAIVRRTAGDAPSDLGMPAHRTMMSQRTARSSCDGEPPGSSTR